MTVPQHAKGMAVKIRTTASAPVLPSESVLKRPKR